MLNLAILSLCSIVTTALGAVVGFALVASPAVALLALVGLASCACTMAGLTSRVRGSRADTREAELARCYRQIWINAGGSLDTDDTLSAPTARG